MKYIDIFLFYLEKISKTFYINISMISPLENGEIIHHYLHLDSQDYHHTGYRSPLIISIPVYGLLTDVDVEILKNQLIQSIGCDTSCRQF